MDVRRGILLRIDHRSHFLSGVAEDCSHAQEYQAFFGREMNSSDSAFCDRLLQVLYRRLAS